MMTPDDRLNCADVMSKSCGDAMEKNKEIAFGIADRNITFAKETIEQTQLCDDGVAGEACDRNGFLKNQTDNKLMMLVVCRRSMRCQGRVGRR